jgi:two-component system phosphate regulon response regulator PhoB
MVAAPGAGEDACDAVDRAEPHLVLLDWDHPGVNARSLIEHVRRSALTCARVMAISSRATEQHIVEGFELGLDEYMLRPYSLAVVAARVRSILRQNRPATAAPPEDFLQFHRLRIDLQDLRLVIEGAIVPLRPMEFRMLEFFMRQPERVFTRAQMVRRIWAGKWDVAERAVDVHVQRTRNALALHGCDNYLQTVRAFGYRLSVL